MKKVLLLLSVIGTVLLCSCSIGTSNAVSNKRIQEDIMSSNIWFYDEDVKITNFYIIKRQTNEEQKEDVVYAAICGQNEDYAFERSFEIKYVFYNDGWRLEEVADYQNGRLEDSLYSHTPLRGVPHEEIEEFIYSINAIDYSVFQSKSFANQPVPTITITPPMEQDKPFI